MGQVAGTQWEMIVVLGCLYGLRRNEVLGLEISKIDLEKGVFKVDEQLPFNLPADTLRLQSLAPTKSKERTLPITDLTRPLFERQKESWMSSRFITKGSSRNSLKFHPKQSKKAVKWSDKLEILLSPFTAFYRLLYR